MKITTKIRIYNVLSWIFLGITFLLTAVYQLRNVSETGRIHVLGFFTEFLVQPYFWLALVLRWRLRENKLRQKNA